jgi:hypothetical protein
MTAANTAGADRIDRAATLLEAVARWCDDAADAEVPLRCGRAADLIRAPSAIRPLPMTDDAAEVRAALREAADLLRSLPAEYLTDAVLAALAETRTAVRLLPRPDGVPPS